LPESASNLIAILWQDRKPYITGIAVIINITAFHLIVKQKQKCPTLSYRQVRSKTAAKCRQLM